MHHLSDLLPCLPYFRYAEIVNVRLGDGQMRKGQVLEIAGKRAVVQVRYIPSLSLESIFLGIIISQIVKLILTLSLFSRRFSKVLPTLIT